MSVSCLEPVHETRPPLPISITHQLEAPFEASLGPLEHHLIVLNITGAVRGTAWFDARSHSKFVPPGRLTFWPAGKGFHLDLKTRMESLHVKLDASVMNDLIAAFGDRADVAQLAPVFAEQDDLLKQLILEAWRAVESNAPSSAGYLTELARSIAARLLWRSCDNRHADASAGLSAGQLQRIDDYIKENIDATISLGDLSAILRKSTSHFSRQFKLAVGKSPYQYILHKRIRKSQELLHHTDKSIVEISLDCGFSHQEHLTHAFRRITGMTPARYRKQVRERGYGGWRMGIDG